MVLANLIFLSLTILAAKKDIDGRHQVHIDFCFYELIWSVYLYLMCLCCENVKDLNFKFQSPESPLPSVIFQTQGMEVNINYMPP
jgi:hypothetical protein